MTTRFRFVNPDHTVRKNYDSDQAQVRVVPPILWPSRVQSYTAMRAEGVHGMRQSGESFPEGEALIPVRVFPQASMDALLTLWDELGQELNRVGNIEWRPEGATRSYFIDHYKSTVPSITQMQGFPWWDPETLEIPRFVLAITVHPEFRDVDGNVKWV